MPSRGGIQWGPQGEVVAAMLYELNSLRTRFLIPSAFAGPPFEAEICGTCVNERGHIHGVS